MGLFFTIVAGLFHLLFGFTMTDGGGDSGAKGKGSDKGQGEDQSEKKTKSGKGKSKGDGQDQAPKTRVIDARTKADPEDEEDADKKAKSPKKTDPVWKASADAATKQLQQQLAAVQAELAESKLAGLRSKIAAKHGIDAEDAAVLLTGTDKKSLEAQAAKIAGLVSVSKSTQPSLRIPFDQKSAKSKSKTTMSDSIAAFAKAMFD
jgi:hypothetical protein